MTLSLTRTASDYRISVTDVGAGIPVQDQSQIFERFFRADKTRSREDAEATAGAGLGLAIGRWIAEAHGGRLELVRSDAAGTEFRITLPGLDVDAVGYGTSSTPSTDRDPLVSTFPTEPDP